MKPTSYTAGQYTITLSENSGQFIDQTPESIKYVDTDRVVIKKIGEKPQHMEFLPDQSLRFFAGKPATEPTKVPYETKKLLLDAKSAFSKKKSFAGSPVDSYLRSAFNQVTGRSAPKNTL